MGGQVNHDYHILEPDIWPLIGSMSALTFTSGMVMNFPSAADTFGSAGTIVMWAGLAGLIATFFMWFKNIVIEAGDQIVLKTGKAKLTMKKDGTIQIEGKDMTLKGTGKMLVKMSKDLIMKAKKIIQN